MSLSNRNDILRSLTASLEEVHRKLDLLAQIDGHPKALAWQEAQRVTGLIRQAALRQLPKAPA